MKNKNKEGNNFKHIGKKCLKKLLLMKLLFIQIDWNCGY